MTSLSRTDAQFVRLFSFLAALAALAACSKQQREDFEDAADFKREAKGDNYEILVVMDKRQLDGPVGEALREAINKPMDGMFQPQAEFLIKPVNVLQFNSLLEEHRNLLFVTDLSNGSQAGRRLQGYFSEESRQEIEKGERALLRMPDKYARNQLVVHVFGKDEAALVENIRENGETILQSFRNLARERLVEDLYARGEKGELVREIYDRHGFRLRVPNGYFKVFNEPDFVWLRYPGQVYDKNLFLSYRPYSSDKQFDKDSLLAWRESICKKYVYSDREGHPDSYLTLQDFPVSEQQISFNGRFGVRLRGMYRANGRMFGGPFVAYAFYDEESGRQYYVEGFVHAPGERKRPPLSELEAVISTFASGKAVDEAFSSTEKGEVSE